MKRSTMAIAVLVLTLCASAACGNTAADHDHNAAAPAESSHLVYDTGAEQKPAIPSVSDWSFNVNDPLALRDFSTAVVSGKVINVERSYVDVSGFIGTVYSVQVDTIYKGEQIADVINIALPGGSLPLGKYISSLDELGLYEMKLAPKAPDMLREKGLDPDREKDPRTLDPTTPVAENWGTNPTSETTLTELAPESWVFFISNSEGDVYYGAGFDHALSYLKNGKVYGVHPESETSPISEAELFAK